MAWIRGKTFNPGPFRLIPVLAVSFEMILFSNFRIKTHAGAKKCVTPMVYISGFIKK